MAINSNFKDFAKDGGGLSATLRPKCYGNISDKALFDRLAFLIQIGNLSIEDLLKKKKKEGADYGV